MLSYLLLRWAKANLGLQPWLKVSIAACKNACSETYGHLHVKGAKQWWHLITHAQSSVMLRLQQPSCASAQYLVCHLQHAKTENDHVGRVCLYLQGEVTSSKPA